MCLVMAANRCEVQHEPRRSCVQALYGGFLGYVRFFGVPATVPGILQSCVEPSRQILEGVEVVVFLQTAGQNVREEYRFRTDHSPACSALSVSEFLTRPNKGNIFHGCGFRHARF